MVVLNTLGRTLAGRKRVQKNGREALHAPIGTEMADLGRLRETGTSFLGPCFINTRASNAKIHWEMGFGPLRDIIWELLQNNPARNQLHKPTKLKARTYRVPTRV